mgnify:CR=1 FL=1|jgi:hypothetical protein
MKKKTQLENVKEYLMQGNPITPIDALAMFGCFRLSDIIFRLKKEGFQFHTELIKNKYGNYFAKYSLINNK